MRITYCRIDDRINAGGNDEMNLENMFEQYEQYAVTSREKLETMLAAISDGRIPTKSDWQQTEQSITLLQQTYDAICEKMKGELPLEELPPNVNAPIAEYRMALEKSRAIRIRKRQEEACRCLQRFLAVYSEIEIYAKAIEECQKKAAAMLQQIETKKELDWDAISEQLLAPQTFLKALACQDFDSEEGLTLYEQIGAQFSPRVQLGITRGKYVLPEETDRPAPAPCLVKQPDPPIGEIDQEEKHEEASDTIPFSRFLTTAGVFANELSEFGELQVETSPAETKKISSSIFGQDFRSAPARNKALISALQDNGCVNAKYLEAAKQMPADVSQFTLEQWFKNGYLRRYSVTPGGQFYCSSPRLHKALCFREASKLAGVQQRKEENCGESIEDRADSAAARVAMVQMSAMCFSHQSKKTPILKKRYSVATSMFFGILSTKSALHNVVMIGAFYNQENETNDIYLRFIQQATEACRAGTCCWLFAGMHLDNAKGLAECTFKELPDLESKVSCYLYSLLENAYYLYPSMEPVAEEKLQIMPEEPFADKAPMESGKDIIKTSEADDSVAVTREKDSSAEKSMEGGSLTQNMSEKEGRSGQAQSEKCHPTPPVPPVILSQNSEDINRKQHVLNELYHMLLERRWYAATAMLKVYSGDGETEMLQYQQLAYALQDPMAHCYYSADNGFKLIGNQSLFENTLLLATALRLFFSNQVQYDYIKPFYDALKDLKPADRFPILSKIMYIFMDFKVTQQVGMDAYAGYRARSRAEVEAELQRLRQEANDFYNNFVMGHKKERCSQKRFLLTKKEIFSTSSDIGQCLYAVADGDYDFYSVTKDFLERHFFDPGVQVCAEGINNNRLWDYIQQAWENAGQQMQYRKNNMPLMSRLRSNIVNETTKVVQLLAKWCMLVEQLNHRGEDNGSRAYQKAQRPLLEQIATARDELASVVKSDSEPVELRAGLQVIDFALEEIASYMDGSFQEDSRTYFYLPFLLTDDILLSEDWMPDLDMYDATLTNLQPSYRILEHVRKMRERTPTCQERLAEMLDGQCDDYGAASMLLEYLSKTQPELDLTEQMEYIEAGENYIRDTAELRKNDFIGELELAQSYGQIDNSVEDQKEKILRIVDAWYEWAKDTANYGFFQKIMQGYLHEIRNTAKERESMLLEQLKDFRHTVVPGMSIETKNKRIEAIQAMIVQQNYTVAEDLLARGAADEEYSIEAVEENFLQEFLDYYEDYYTPVANRSISFAALVRNRTHNKEERGAKALAERWLPGGSHMGADRVRMLMDQLGFPVATVETLAPIAKLGFENYVVRTSKRIVNQAGHYSHPIAPLGSGAAEQGFRVVCINGVYDADNLIEIMKKIGNTRHTVILLDYALPKSERRRLARKTKSSLGDKLFVVVDRVVMMYLIRNYDATKINRMLVSLLVPFGYYQPYVWESANTMPPEIFMGRKMELEQIKSAYGVNIVYGGRQLGKSALLKKARDDIDYDENGDRAIYIDIKAKNYREAAKKISHELYDQKILNQDLNTEDWDELTRALRQRLNSETEPYISYLLLLMDEADAFIDSCEKINYKPFDALKEVQGIGNGRFKFVVAGLRNVVRFKRDAALGNNSVLTHLRSMTVKPFDIAEARELLEVPLHYMGLRFPKEKESLITLILATTNYFPGLIQLYCAKLLEAMRNRDYAGYNEMDTPIYEVSERHIKKVLSDPEFTKQIREKFMITLKVDEDKYYYLIALLLAYLYHTDSKLAGYTAEDIQAAGNVLGIPMIARLELEKLKAFLEELKELNVLRSADDMHYLFTRVTFFQMMGTFSEVEDELMEYMAL